MINRYLIDYKITHLLHRCLYNFLWHDHRILIYLFLVCWATWKSTSSRTNRYDYWSLHCYSPASTSANWVYHPTSTPSLWRRYSNILAARITPRGPSDPTTSSWWLPRCAASSSSTASRTRNGRRATRFCWIRCCYSIWIRKFCISILCRILLRAFSDASPSPRRRSGRLKEQCLFRCMWPRLRCSCCLCALLCSWGCICFRNRTFASIFRIRFMITFYLRIFIRRYNAAFYWTVIFYVRFWLSFYGVYRNPFWICKLDGIYTVGIVYFIRNDHHRDNSFLSILERWWKILWIGDLFIWCILMALRWGLISIGKYFTWRSKWSHFMYGFLLF